MSSYGFKFVDSTETIIAKLNEAGIKKLQSSFYNLKNLQNIKNIVSSFVKAAIKNTITWQSLSNDSPLGLHAHLGLNASTKNERLERILNIWAEQIEVRPRTIQRRSQSFVFAYDFYAIEANFAEILGSYDAIVENKSKNSNEGKTPKIIPWLSWLLVAGDQAQIDGYHIAFGNFPISSRSGKALMRPRGSYVIPSAFGPFQVSNNFVTRALEDLATNTNFRSNLNTILEGTLGGGLAGIDFSSIDEGSI